MIAASNRRFVKREGEPVTLRNYTQVGTDEYGDPEFDEETESTSAVISLPTDPETVRTPAGEESFVDARIWLPDDATVTESTDDTTRATEIERDNTSDSYRVVVVFHEGNGVYRVEAERNAR